jgi:hypothetical protein
MQSLDKLPFLKSLCWQGHAASLVWLSEDEILQLYERNWRYRGVVADLSEDEKIMLLQLATKYQAWIVSEL